MNSIFHRVSIRKYQDKEVDQEKIEKLLRAAMAAPSAHNQQPWEYYVVRTLLSSCHRLHLIQNVQKMHRWYLFHVIGQRVLHRSTSILI